MENEFLKYFSRFRPLTDEESAAIIHDICIERFKKGTILLREGQISKDVFFVLKGCVRQYLISDGDEKNTDFFTEEKWVLTTVNYADNTPATYYLSCLEDCILVVGNSENDKKLYQNFPELEALARSIMEQEIIKYKETLVSYITDSPEQRYVKLLRNRPELIQRVPQHHLASYLGIKPESLSRIRKRIFNKNTFN